MPDLHQGACRSVPRPADHDAYPVAPPPRAALMRGYSFEITCKDLGQVRAAQVEIPSGTRVNVTALSRESEADRITAIAELVDLGLRPVPHIAARALTSTRRLRSLLSRLDAVGATDEIFVIGGDRKESAGPFGSGLELIRSGLLAEHGVRRVGIPAYPEGHPFISAQVLSREFAQKLVALDEQGLRAFAISQFCFDVPAVRQWVRKASASGRLTELRVGVPGPTTVRRLMRYASLFGVKSSSGIVRKYGISLTNLMSTAKPGRFIDDFAEALPGSLPTPVALHFYTFGAVAATVRWIDEYQSQGGEHARNPQ